MSPTSRDVPYTGLVMTGMSGYEGDAAIVVGTSDASRTEITRAVAGVNAAGDRVLVAAFQGSQRTGGYLVRIERIERDGDRLVVHATFTEPAAGAVVTQVLTSPAHVVSIAASDVAGVARATLVDAAGAERAHVDLR